MKRPSRLYRLAGGSCLSGISAQEAAAILTSPSRVLAARMEGVNPSLTLKITEMAIAMKNGEYKNPEESK